MARRKKDCISFVAKSPKKTYHRFHNLIIPSRNGTTQIDHVVISPYGVFIIETKNMGGKYYLLILFLKVKSPA